MGSSDLEGSSQVKNAFTRRDNHINKLHFETVFWTLGFFTPVINRQRGVLLLLSKVIDFGYQGEIELLPLSGGKQDFGLQMVLLGASWYSHAL